MAPAYIHLATQVATQFYATTRDQSDGLHVEATHLRAIVITLALQSALACPETESTLLPEPRRGP